MIRTAPILQSEEFQNWSVENIVDHLMHEVSKTPLIQTFGKFVKFFQDHHRCEIDIHDDNIMVRPGSNVIVFTDPMA